MRNTKPSITCRNEEFSRVLMSLIHNVCFKSNPVGCVHTQRCSLNQDAVPGKRKVELSESRATVPSANTESKLGQKSHELGPISNIPSLAKQACLLLLVMNATRHKAVSTPQPVFPGPSPPSPLTPLRSQLIPAPGLGTVRPLFSTSTSL